MQQHQEEAEENRKRREERSMRRKQYAKALSQVPLIPCGGIEEYERIRGYEPGTVELLDIGGQNKGVVFYLSSRTLGNTNPVLYDDCTEHLIDAGLDGLIVRSSNMHYHHPAYYCLPVRKINPTNTAE
ncbi:MAG: hypothetical protein OXR66_02510 [Candidatus Woesearchaeota archaeon]|nr:hypothetical protein [Candidatus Woesearchaeota archaeon]